jgi:glyoxylase-like metal-dependent hydrolase (beta-lactamase superfamily II)
MKIPVLTIIISFFSFTMSFAQEESIQILGKEVFKNEDVIFRQIDEHTWVGTGHEMYNESLYLVEGNDKAVLIDAGTKIADLDKIVASLTTKPILLVATHVHPDHTGSAINYFPEIFINQADTVMIPHIMPDYKGLVKYLKDGEIIDLGKRKLEVVFTPGHTPGSVTFIDKNAGYGFSGDSFGSGTLLLDLDFSTLISTCLKIGAIMDEFGINSLYPGHYDGKNSETRKRINDIIILSKDVLSGKAVGEKSQWGGLVISAYGVNINYSEKAIK